MKVIFLSLTFVTCIAFALAKAEEALSCESKVPDVPKEWLDMDRACVADVRKQITEELKASMAYLAMASHFSRDVINRPGFAKMFFQAASEERDHANKLISYLLMRGQLSSSVSNLFHTYYPVNKTAWSSGLDALKDALRLEATVTNSIKRVIKLCENSNDNNDYHFVDYLTGDFLDEQYKGQRDLAGKVSTLDKFMDRHGALGEFLYDKKLLSAAE